MVTFSDYAGNYLKGVDLQGREWLVAIDKIVEEDVGDSDKLVAHFAGRRKSLPLNKGHIAILSQAFGEDPANCQWPAGDPLSGEHPNPQGAAAIGVRIKLPAATGQKWGDGGGHRANLGDGSALSNRPGAE